MEYVLGSIVTIVAVSVVYLSINKIAFSKKTIRVLSSQSRHFELMLPFIENMRGSTRPNVGKNIETQSTKHFDSQTIKIVFYEDMAYWIDSNVLYTANLVSGHVDSETVKIVDTMTLDDVELKKLSSIVEMLTEGSSHDSGNPGN